MPANTAPIYVRTPQIEWVSVPPSVANTAKDGTGTVYTVFTGDATEGSFVEYIRIKPNGTNVATVLRFFLNNGSTNATATNNSYFSEVQCGATTNSEIASIPELQIPMNIALPPGYKINVAISTSVAAGFQVTGIGGKY
jgi:hypothetical protein